MATLLQHKIFFLAIFISSWLGCAMLKNSDKTEFFAGLLVGIFGTFVSANLDMQANRQ